MPVETYKPVPLGLLKSIMKRFSYQCVLDKFPVLHFEKDGSKPQGYEKAVEYWPQLLTVRHPDFISEKFPGEPVYDSSEIVDLLSYFLLRAAPTMTRTEVSQTLKAVLTPTLVPGPEPTDSPNPVVPPPAGDG